MPKRAITPEDLYKFLFVSDPQFCPTSGDILFSRKHINEKNKYITNLFSVSATGEVKQWTQGDKGAGHGRWSPDGSSIVFISGRDDSGSQLYHMPADGGEGIKLTELEEGSISEFKWSPDGTKVAFQYRATHPERTKKAAKEREEKGLSTPPWVIDTPWYKLDGDGYFGEQRYEIFVMEVATKAVKKVYGGSALGMYSFGWAPTSDKLAVAHNTVENPWKEKAKDRIHIVDLDGNSKVIPGQVDGNKGNVSWSPNGEWIAFTGHVDSTDAWDVKNQRIFLISPNGGPAKCLTENDDYCFEAATLSDTKEFASSGLLLWSPDSEAIYTNVAFEGQSQLGYVPVAKGGVEILTKGNHYAALNCLSKDGSKLACVFGDPLTLNEIAVYDIEKHSDTPEILTHFNDAFHEEVKLSEPHTVWLDTPDGHKVQMWFMNPVEPKERKSAAILQIHGGPHAQYGWAFFHEFQVLAAAGYTVVFSNPRGSKGYGEDHCNAIKGDWGNKDWIDIETVMKWMQAQPSIHAGRMGVMGGSYGGYMTNWVVGHTDAFKAAITDRCVSNLLSMGGNSDFVDEKDGYFGKGNWFGPLADIESRWKQSPMAYFDKVKTPMMIIHSEGDLRCNVEQGEQVFSALWQMGIEVKFVRYPSTTSHGLSRSGPPDLRLHRIGQILGWWEKHIG